VAPQIKHGVTPSLDGVSSECGMIFGTLRYDSRSNDAEFVDLTSEFLAHDLDGYAAPHLACDVCRMKKVRGIQSLCTMSSVREADGHRSNHS
jgi:hypothetical protein